MSKKKEGYCDIIVIIDRSGSMLSIQDEVIGGFNNFITEQKKVKGEARLSLIQFDDQYEINYIAKDIQKIKELDRESYEPRGMTAMMDAIGRTLMQADNRISNMKKKNRPDKKIVLIQTDGAENASQEYSADAVKKMIKEKKGKGWEFVFLGADIDAAQTATNIGINVANTIKFKKSAAGTNAVFSSLSANMTNYRSGATSNMAYTSADKADQDKA